MSVDYSPSHEQAEKGLAPKVVLGAVFAAVGGQGYDGCQTSEPTVGGAGGKGGDLTVRVPAAKIVKVEIVSSFNGGDGGEGIPSPQNELAPGGEPGRFPNDAAMWPGGLDGLKSQASFRPGRTGEMCPEGH